MPSWSGHWAEVGRSGGGKGRGGGGGGPGRGGGAAGGGAAGRGVGSPRETTSGAGDENGDTSQRSERLTSQIDNLERDYKQALQKIQEKQSEKFDLIFNILRELQDRQARLEESINMLMSAGGVGGTCASGGNCGVGGCTASTGSCGGGCMGMQGCNYGGFNGCGGCSGCGNSCDGGVWIGGNFQYQDMHYGNGCFGNHAGFNGNGCRGGMMMQPQQQLGGQESQPNQQNGGQDQQQSQQQPQQPWSPMQQPQSQRPADSQADGGSAEASGGAGPWPHARHDGGSSGHTSTVASGAHGGTSGSDPSWGKLRIWKVVNLPDSPKALPVVSRAEAYAPGYPRPPAEDIVVAWLRNGDMLKQVGHSKKMRGHMVMPVRILRGVDASDNVQQAAAAAEEGEEGWVTRRLVGSSVGPAWFEEITGGEA